MVFEIVRFHLQACGGKGKGMGLCMILVLSGIMWGNPYVVRERQCVWFITGRVLNTKTVKGLSVIIRPLLDLKARLRCQAYFRVENITDSTFQITAAEK